MEAEIFRQLNGGARFDRKKCGEHMALFEKGKRRDATLSRKLAQSTAPPSLDFFGSFSQTKPKKQKRKRATIAATLKSESSVKKLKPGIISKARLDDKDDDVQTGEESSDGEEQLTVFSNVDSTVKLVSDSDNEKSAEDKAKAELKAFRKRLSIKISGSDPPPPLESFHDIELEENPHFRNILLENIERSKYIDPTPVQMQALPILFAGRDILAAAPTGSGKTAAFAIPMLKKICCKRVEGSKGPRGLVLAPTRELAAQIVREFERLSKGKKFRIQLLTKSTAVSIASSSNIDIIVSTPMQVLQITKGAGETPGAWVSKPLSLSSIEMVVLDEADKLLEMDGGFLQQIDSVLSLCNNSKIQRAMFSATLPQNVEELAQSVLREPIRLVIGTRNAGASTIDQELLFVGMEQGKLLAIRQLVQKGFKPPAIIFVQSKDRAQELFRELVYDGINVDVIHSDRSKAQRDQIITRFRTGAIWVLIATDLMCRGVDFKGVQTVINFDFPQSGVSYVHRIGRTGRAGRRGRAVTFFTESDISRLRTIANIMKLSGCNVPSWMLQIKKQNSGDRRKQKTSAINRHSISTASTYDRRAAAKKANMIKQSKEKRDRERRTGIKARGRGPKRKKSSNSVNTGEWQDASAFNS